MKKTLFFLATMFMVSCGGGSGVDGEKYADELTAEEARKLCEWGIEQQGGAGEKDCGNMVTVTIKTVDDCADDARPHCQVKVYEECVEAIDGNACNIFTKSECAAYIACGTTQD